MRKMRHLKRLLILVAVAVLVQPGLLVTVACWLGAGYELMALVSEL